MKTKQGHADFVDWLPFLGCIAVVFAGPLANLFLPEKANYLEVRQWITDHGWYFSVVGLIILAGMAFWHSFEFYDSANQRLTEIETARPRFRVAHHISIFGSRMVERAMMSLGPWSNCAYRLQVNNDGPVNATGCHGVITEIQKEGENVPRWGGNNARLTFAPSRDGDSLSKTVHANGGHEWLDIIFLEFLNSRYFRVGKMGIRDAQDWPQPTVEEIFSDEGVYYFVIQIRSDQLPPMPVRIRFNLIRWPDASEMEIMR